MMGLFERSARKLGDDLLGFHIGDLMQPEDFGLWARYALSAPYLHGMILRADRALRYHQAGSEFDLQIAGGLARWSYRVLEPVSFGRRHHSDHSLLPMLAGLRCYLGANWTPSRVEFDYDRPSHFRMLEQRFKAPVVFNATANAIVFKSHLLSSPSKSRTPLASRVTFADLRRVASRHPPRNHVEAVREMIRLRLNEPLADIEGVARLLNVSRRTLQRQLSEEGWSYRDLLEQVRADRAFQLIAGSGSSITDIALGLGYGDVPSFTRAFRRWKGRAPSDFRRASRQDAAQEPVA